MSARETVGEFRQRWLSIRRVIQPSSVDRASATIRAFVQRSAIDPAALVAVLASTPRMKLDRQLDALRRALNGEPIRDIRALRVVVEQLEERFDEPLQSVLLITRREKSAKRTGDVIGVLLLLGCTYLVVGGLVTGKSRLLPGHPVISVLLFCTFIAGLGLFEAMHVSATLLKLANIDALRDRYPRAHVAHTLIRRSEDIIRFLAGRQVVVIVVVFFTAQLTSFPAMKTYPFTSAALSNPMRHLLEWGIPGALVLLWLGQLSPQFVATKRVLWLMNTRIAGMAIRLGFLLETVGITRVGLWLSRLVIGEEERIPSAPAERWQHIAVDEVGHATVAISRSIDISRTDVTVTGQRARSVRKSGIGLIVEEDLILASNDPVSLQASQSGSLGVTGMLSLVVEQEEERVEGGLRYRRVLRPAVGSFPPGALIRTRLQATFDTRLQQDAVYLDGPARFILWRLVTVGVPEFLAPAHIQAYTIGSGLSELTPVGTAIAVEPQDNGDALEVSYALDFPVPHRLYVLSWGVAW